MKIIDLYNIPIKIILQCHEKFYKLINIFFTFIIINLWKFKLFQLITPNGVTYFRTCLAIPCCYFINNNYYYYASFLVIINDILDFFDGALARVLREKFNIVFDGCYGSYVDAVCDKIFNITVWSYIIYFKLYNNDISLNINFLNILTLSILILIESLSFIERTRTYLKYPNKTQLASQIGKTKQTFQMLYTYFLLINLYKTKYEYIIFIPTLHFSFYSLYNKICATLNRLIN